MWQRIAILLVLVAAGGRCNPSNDTTAEPAKASLSSSTLSVAAASDLRFALEELAAVFTRAHPDVEVKVSFGASGNLFSQLSNGAPFDLFLSADASFPQKLIESGIGVKGSEFTYGVGHLALWVPKGSTVDPGSARLEILTHPSVRRIAIANPAHAPYGRAAVEALKTAGIFEDVRERLVMGETVAQAAYFVESGAADVGVIAASLVHAPAMREKGNSWQIPPHLHPGLQQAGVILSRAKDSAAASQFRQFLLSAEARAVLDRHGFELPR